MRRKIGLVAATTAAALVAASPLAFAGGWDAPAPSNGNHQHDEKKKGTDDDDCPGLIADVAGETAGEVEDHAEAAGAAEGTVELCGPLIDLDAIVE